MVNVKFEKQTYGAVVATILELDDSIVEVQERNDGVYGLIIHTRRHDTDHWDDLTAYLRSEHFDALASVARRMRGERECCLGLAPPFECECERISGKLTRMRKDRDDQDVALLDAVRETVQYADELAFWKYHAIWGRASLLEPASVGRIFPEDSAVWKEAARQLDDARRQGNIDPIGACK